MAPASRYSPEVEEELVLRAAAKVIENSSILDFKMSDIAAKAGISMGSVYKHVQSKEDVLIALVTKMLENIFDRFDIILKMPLTLPERFAAIYLADFSIIGLYPFDGHMHMLVTNEAVLSKGSARWRDKMLLWDHKIEALIYKSLEDAIETGELRSTNKLAELDQLNLGLWALAAGFSNISLQKKGFSVYSDEKALEKPYSPTGPQLECVMAFLSAYPWETALTEEGVSRAYASLKDMGFRQ
ncbi:MAG: hypothetical protein COB59_02595 [Rhodospirillaceae bacterium]|nr:MAG: hypothetical protein COB59_02595 [Rhodospirillaceae bacterium]